MSEDTKTEKCKTCEYYDPSLHLVNINMPLELNTNGHCTFLSEHIHEVNMDCECGYYPSQYTPRIVIESTPVKEITNWEI